jgi:hypothetical protein
MPGEPKNGEEVQKHDRQGRRPQTRQFGGPSKQKSGGESKKLAGPGTRQTGSSKQRKG